MEEQSISTTPQDGVDCWNPGEVGQLRPREVICGEAFGVSSLRVLSRVFTARLCGRASSFSPAGSTPAFH